MLCALIALVLSFAAAKTFAARAKCESQFVKIGASESPTRLENFYAEVKSQDGGHRVVYFEQIPAKRGKPTLVLMNGLFVPRADLEAFRREFEAAAKGEGLVIIYYSTQMESLAVRHQVEGQAQKNLEANATPSDFAFEAAEILRVAKVQGPITLVGYSYGGLPLAQLLSLMHEGKVKLPTVRESIFMASLVEPTDGVPFGGMLNAGRSQMEGLMAFNPFFGPQGVQKMRESSIRNSAVGIVDNNLMGGFKLPDGVSRSTMVQALASQIGAAQDFDLRADGAKMKGNVGPVHFIIAGHEIAGRTSAQKAAALAWGASTDVLADVPHHMLAFKPDVVVPVLLKRMRK